MNISPPCKKKKFLGRIRIPLIKYVIKPTLFNGESRIHLHENTFCSVALRTPKHLLKMKTDFILWFDPFDC